MRSKILRAGLTTGGVLLTAGLLMTACSKRRASDETADTTGARLSSDAAEAGAAPGLPADASATPAASGGAGTGAGAGPH